MPGRLLLHAGDHGAAGRLIAEYARYIGATTIVLGAPRHGGLATLMDASTSQRCCEPHGRTSCGAFRATVS